MAYWLCNVAQQTSMMPVLFRKKDLNCENIFFQTHTSGKKKKTDAFIVKRSSKQSFGGSTCKVDHLCKEDKCKIKIKRKKYFLFLCYCL